MFADLAGQLVSAFLLLIAGSFLLMDHTLIRDGYLEYYWKMPHLRIIVYVFVLPTLIISFSQRINTYLYTLFLFSIIIAFLIARSQYPIECSRIIVRVNLAIKSFYSLHRLIVLPIIIATLLLLYYLSLNAINILLSTSVVFIIIFRYLFS